ncbi:MAG: MFS transporter [Pseudomonadota bacterium]
MSRLARLTLVLVVFVDMIGQGLVFPILDTLFMDPDGGFLPKDLSSGARSFSYGLVIASYFFAWFLGVTFISKLSDAIGRKSALLVCLGGALIGYALVIWSLYIGSLWLLILGRVITGFTAGNKPIAQAAMIDASESAAERDRNLGFISAAMSIGLVGGPILGALFSSTALFGDAVSLVTPFYSALALVALTMWMVLTFFDDARGPSSRASENVKIRPFDVIAALLRLREFPIVARLIPVFALFMAANLPVYIFITNYMTLAFGYGIIGSSLTMLVVGLAVGSSGVFLVAPAQERLTKKMIVAVLLATMALCSLLMSVAPNGILTLVAVFVFFTAFGIAYPTLIGVFSASVSSGEQGWVMGIATAVFTLAGGFFSLVGGAVMSLDVHLPFYISAACALIGLVFLVAGWRRPEIARIVLTRTDTRSKGSV